MAEVNPQNNIYVINSDAEWPDQLDQYIVYNVTYDFDPVGPGWYGWDGNSLVYLGPGMGAYGGLGRDTLIGPISIGTTPVIIDAEYELPSTGLTPDATANNITLDFSGDYQGIVNITYGIDKAAIAVFNLFINGVQSGADVTVENSNQIDFQNVSFGSINTFSAGDVIDVRISIPAGPEDLTLDRYRLMLTLIGEAVVVPVP